MNQMRYQQTDVRDGGLNRENNVRRCVNAAVDENYQSYLLDYLLDDARFIEDYPTACLEPLGYNQAIIYIERPGAFTGEKEDIDYNKVPRCFGLMDAKELEEIGVLRVRQFPQLELRGRGTLIGIIDTGVTLTNPLFQYEDGTTKVAAYWDQSDQTGRTPDRFSFGTEWSREEIDEALAEEPRILPRDENGHGTFLASVAAGREDEEEGFSGVAPDSELIVVKLKRPKNYLLDFYSISDSVWACQEDDVLLAVHYVLTTAARMGKPVSICLGIGTNMGGHSGHGSLERYISSNSLLPGISFHIASGNEGISGHHFHGEVPGGEEPQTVEFNVAEGENGFIMELWGDAPVTFSVGLTSPGGENVERLQLKLNEFRSIRFFPENTVLQIRSFVGETIGGEQVIRMNFRTPVPGLWKLHVYASGDGNRSYDLWMPISNFLKEDTFFLNAVSTETLTSPGDAYYGITYVPFDVNTESLYVRASRGYTRDGRIKPDLAAPGVSVTVPAPSAGTSPDAGEGRRELNRSGSSVAAAFGTGIGALMQEWAIVQNNDPSLNGQNIRFYLIQGAVRGGAYEYPNRDWGYGIVNVYNAFLSMRR